MALIACAGPRPDIKVGSAGWSDQLKAGDFDAYRAKAGYRFLIVSAGIKFETPTELSTDDMFVVSSDGKLYPAAGAGGEMIPYLSPTQQATAYNMGRTHSKVTSCACRFVFVIPTAATNQSFALQYRSAPSIPLSIK
jgi:hypothetical protein